MATRRTPSGSGKRESCVPSVEIEDYGDVTGYVEINPCLSAKSTNSGLLLIWKDFMISYL
jgi:hypothetical protein